MSFESSASRRSMLGLLAASRRLATTLASAAGEQLSRAAARYRLELRRIATALALSIAAALLAVAALVFVALAVMLAFWPTHPVAAAAAIALAFATLAFVAGLLVRRSTGRD